MNTVTLDAVRLETGAGPRCAVIWLHGLGADGHDFEPLVPQLQLETPVRFIFPHAPRRPVTLNGGAVMRAWYDITGLEMTQGQDAEGIKVSGSQVRALMAEQNGAGIPDERIVLAGFSQGGAIALYAGLRHARPIAGILALSTYLPLGESTKAELSEVNAGLPIFMAHGDLDPVIPVHLGDRSRRYLESLGYDVEWHRYPMAHAVCSPEIADLAAWLRAQLGANP